MKPTRTVRLELLRHGPPHNQLLSPLTQYLALCGNHPSVTVHVPYEHAQFLARHTALSYRTTGRDEKSTRQQRELQLQITAQEMSQILSGIPGLISELKECQKGSEFLHFELVLSASELALLPFELANSPNGFPGAGQPLALQSQSPLCITRRVNRVDNERFRWPDRFKILFAEALPPADAKDLVPAHTLALRKAIDPWIGKSSLDESSGDDASVPTWVSRYLKIIRRATVESIFSELRTGEYTHVHLLAHGVGHKEGVDDRFAIRLYDAQNPGQWDDVGAARLTALMRSIRKHGNGSLAQPSVVTLASCHGAEQGSVVGAGSSIAHALHEADIPLVVASQFPLSFPASILMVQALYEGILWGTDPRVLLNDLRRRLKSHLPDTHDWASLMAYASLPTNITWQLRRVRYQQVFRSIQAAFSFSDTLIDNWLGKQNATADDTGTLLQFAEKLREQRDETQNLAQERQLNSRLADATRRLNKLKREISDKARHGKEEAKLLASMCGRHASTTKRKAELAFYKELTLTEENTIRYGRDWLPILKESARSYMEAFDADRSQTWALVQHLVLSTVVHDWQLVVTLQTDDGETWEEWKPEPPSDRWHEEFSAAQTLSERDRYHADLEVRLWTLGNLIELELLSLRCATDHDDLAARLDTARRKTRIHLDDMVQLVRSNQDDGQLISTLRQLRRCRDWFLLPQPILLLVDEGFSVPEQIPSLIKGLCVELLSAASKR